tara:strand:+ start:151730 stop:152350 length:621 start_codon:yes stop_codon:yes gene_type:complete
LNHKDIDIYQIDKNIILREYEVIQEKIDKIGHFKFVIKGWTITVVSGLLVGLQTIKQFNFFYYIPIPVIIILFMILEEKQAILSKVLCNRAERLELLLNRMSDPIKKINPIKREISISLAYAKVRKTPYIAHELRYKAKNDLKAVVEVVQDVNFFKRYFFYTVVFLMVASFGFGDWLLNSKSTVIKGSESIKASCCLEKIKGIKLK